MNYKKTLLSIIYIYYLELIYHLFIFKSFTIKEFLFLTLFTILFGIFNDLITSLFNKKINKWLFISINVFLSILFIAQVINFKFYGNIISIYSVVHGGQVFGFMGAIISVILKNIPCVLLLLIPAILLLVFNKHIETDDSNYKNTLIKALVFVGLFTICTLTLNIDKKDIYSAKNLYYYKHAPNQSAKTFGILTTMRIDLERIIHFKEKTIDISTEDTTEEEKPTIKNIEYNKEDIDFAALAESETNEEIKNIHLYMNNQEATEKNKYTGMFEGKNLIAITAEAFSPLAVDKDLTPTLYKLVHEGFDFTNMYSPIYYVSTSDGEYVTLTSLLPKESVWSFYKSSKNYLPYVYGNIFKKLGYSAYAFHDGQYKYYDRNLSHPNMGYTYMACGNGLQKLMNCKKWPQSDIEMIDATFDMYKDEEKFVTYYMTISGHLEYNFYGNNMAAKNKSLVENTNYSTAVKAYKATQIELDRALEKLLTKLKDNNLLDKTVIVLSADHYPYGLTNDEINEVTPLTNPKFDIHKNNLIIWSSDIKEPIKVDKLAESLDILPTVLNLFGVKFDSRLLMGRDILSNADGLVILNDRSWITEKGFYDASTNKFTKTTDEELPENYVDKISTIVYNKFVISKNILETNYYKYVFKEEAWI